MLTNYEVDVNQPTDKLGRCLLHLLIADENNDDLALVLSIPREGFKTSIKPNLNLIDGKLGWTPLVTAIIQGPTGNQDAINSLLRAGADATLEVPCGEAGGASLTPA